MEKPVMSGSERMWMRIAIGLAVVILGWFVLQFVVHTLFALIRIALLLALLGIVGWFVLIGPPGGDD